MKQGFISLLKILLGAALVTIVASLVGAVSFPLFLPVERQIMIGWWKYLLLLAGTVRPRPFLLILGATFAMLAFVAAHLSFRWRARHEEETWKWSGTLRLMITAAAFLGAGLIARELTVEILWLADDRNWTEKTRPPEDPVSAGRRLATALRLYAGDEQGSYPRQIEDLARLAILPPDDFHKLFLREWKPGNVQPWFYVSSFNDSAPGELPLLVSPALKNDARVVVFNDISVKEMDASQFRQWVEKWKGEFKAYREVMPKFLSDL